MTSTVMLAAIRTILDEASASFWTDAETYAALADGQNEVIKELLNVYRVKQKIDSALPYELEAVLNEDTGTLAVDPTVLVVPTGFMELISATYDHDNTGGENPCFISSLPDLEFIEDITFLAASGTNPRIYMKTVSDALNLIFLPTKTATAPYTIHYIKSPTDIASGQSATLPVSTHSAIVNYAVSRMFQKDDRPQESQVWYQKYFQELQSLLR